MPCWPKRIFKILDLLQIPKISQVLLRLLTRTSVLTAEELEAADQVLGSEAVQYPKVRIAEGGVMALVFKINGDRAMTLFHTINLPAKGHHSRGHLKLLVHDMVHVKQFEKVGSVYLAQDVQAQKTKGYKYGGWQGLAEKCPGGKRFSDFNREQQGPIAQGYYDDALTADPPSTDEQKQAFEPYIADLQAGIL